MRQCLGEVFELLPVLAERDSQVAGSMIGGQQMVAIGRALMARPRVLLLDEPTEGLAPVIVQQIGQVLAAIRQKGLTVLLVEQNLHFATSVADRHYVMDSGRIIDMIPRAEVARSMARLEDYLGV